LPPNHEHDTDLNGQADEFEWAPCRFSDLGWRYQKKGTYNSYLNHPNKKNVVGFMNTVQDNGSSFGKYYAESQRSKSYLMQSEIKSRSDLES
jgi:hypothetical protein